RGEWNMFRLTRPHPLIKLRPLTLTNRKRPINLLLPRQRISPLPPLRPKLHRLPLLQLIHRLWWFKHLQLRRSKWSPSTPVLNTSGSLATGQSASVVAGFGLEVVTWFGLIRMRFGSAVIGRTAAMAMFGSADIGGSQMN